MNSVENYTHDRRVCLQKRSSSSQSTVAPSLADMHLHDGVARVIGHGVQHLLVAEACVVENVVNIAVFSVGGCEDTRTRKWWQK